MDEAKARELILTLVRYDAHQIKGIKQLCQEWQVEPAIEYPNDGGRSYYDIPKTIRRLALHVTGQVEEIESE